MIAERETLEAMHREAIKHADRAEGYFRHASERRDALAAALRAMDGGMPLPSIPEPEPDPQAAPKASRRGVPVSAAAADREQQVLRVLGSGPKSRTDLIVALGCSPASVTKATSALIAAGEVVGRGATTSRVFEIACGAAAAPSPPAPAAPPIAPREPKAEPAPKVDRRRLPRPPRPESVVIDEKVVAVMRRGASTRRDILERAGITQRQFDHSIGRLGNKVVATGRTKARRFTLVGRAGQARVSLDQALGSAPGQGMTVTEFAKHLGLGATDARKAADKMIAARKIRQDDNGRLYVVRP